MNCRVFLLDWSPDGRFLLNAVIGKWESPAIEMATVSRHPFFKASSGTGPQNFLQTGERHPAITDLEQLERPQEFPIDESPTSCRLCSISG